jgi:hypothetical protein
VSQLFNNIYIVNMDFESDEMFKLLKVKMSDWATAARIAQAAAQPVAAAGLATKAGKPGKEPPNKKAADPKAGAA